MGPRTTRVRSSRHPVQTKVRFVRRAEKRMKPLPPMAMASRIANIDLPETPPLRTREVVSNVMLTTLGDVVSVKLGAVQLTPAGAGLGATQARVMVPLKPLTALNVSGTLTKLPAATVTLVVVLPLASPMVKSWPV